MTVYGYISISTRNKYTIFFLIALKRQSLHREKVFNHPI